MVHSLTQRKAKMTESYEWGEAHCGPTAGPRKRNRTLAQSVAPTTPRVNSKFNAAAGQGYVVGVAPGPRPGTESGGGPFAGTRADDKSQPPLVLW